MSTKSRKNGGAANTSRSQSTAMECLFSGSWLIALSLVLVICMFGSAALAEENGAPAAAECETCDEAVVGDTMPPDEGLDGTATNGELPVDGADTPVCEPEEDLELLCSYEEDGQPGTFWESGDDYTAGLLTVNYRLNNNGPSNLVNVRVTEATANNEVKLATELPLMLGIIEAGSFTTFNLKWQLPNTDVTWFRTDIEVCADCPSENEINGGPDLPVAEITQEPDTVIAHAVLPATGYALAVALTLGLGLTATGLGCIALSRRKRQPEAARIDRERS